MVWGRDVLRKKLCRRIHTDQGGTENVQTFSEGMLYFNVNFCVSPDFNVCAVGSGGHAA
jgi:hypothetical protein